MGQTQGRRQRGGQWCLAPHLKLVLPHWCGLQLHTPEGCLPLLGRAGGAWERWVEIGVTGVAVPTRKFVGMFS